LIAALISVALITGATALGNNIGNTFNNLSDHMDDAATAAK
ncbi:Flp family type IVb pilin, partial [Rhizobium leguminosarum]